MSRPFDELLLSKERPSLLTLCRRRPRMDQEATSRTIYSTCCSKLLTRRQRTGRILVRRWNSRRHTSCQTSCRNGSGWHLASSHTWPWPAQITRGWSGTARGRCSGKKMYIVPKLLYTQYLRLITSERQMIFWARPVLYFLGTYRTNM